MIKNLKTKGKCNSYREILRKIMLQKGLNIKIYISSIAFIHLNSRYNNINHDKIKFRNSPNPHLLMQLSKIIITIDVGHYRLKKDNIVSYIVYEIISQLSKFLNHEKK